MMASIVRFHGIILLVQPINWGSC